MKAEELAEHDPSNIVFHLQLGNFTYNVQGIAIYFLKHLFDMFQHLDLNVITSTISFIIMLIDFEKKKPFSLWFMG